MINRDLMFQILTAVVLLKANHVEAAIKLPPSTNSFTRFAPSAEQRLLHRLMSGYDRAIRPAMKPNDSITVQIGISLTMILDVDEKNQVLSTTVWLDQKWHDLRLKWNSSEYEGVHSFRVPCSLIWLPDIVLYNSVSDHAGYHKALAWLYSDGAVFWPPIVRMRSSCKLDITYFPFDDQVCHLKLGSWAYDGNQLDVISLKDRIDTENFVDNGEWHIVNTSVKRNVKIYPCCNEPYPDITFYLHLRRRNMFYTFNVIIPCVLLSTLTLIGFVLPPDSGEKVALGLTVLLAYSVFLLLVAESMPPTSEFSPLIGIYLTVVMSMTSLSVICAVLVLNIHHRGKDHSAPPRLLMLMCTHFFGRLVCLTHKVATTKGYNFGMKKTSKLKLPRSKSFLFENKADEDVIYSNKCFNSLQDNFFEEQGVATHSTKQPLLNHFSSLSNNKSNMLQQNLKIFDEESSNIPLIPLKSSSLCVNNVAQTLSSPPKLKKQSNSALEFNHLAPLACHDSISSLLMEGEDESVVHSSADVMSPKHHKRLSTTRRGAIVDNIQKDMSDHLSKIVERQKRADEAVRRVYEWQYVALVLDRLLFLLFTCVTLVSTIWLLIIKPMTKELA